MRRLPALPLAASLLLLCPVLHASVHQHRRGAHAIVRRSVGAHSHATHLVQHTSYASISTDRATQIQQALIQRGYLSGAPTGSWDAASVAAMQKMQGDNGWQTKLVPDSRALIKLGLGPGNDSVPAANATQASTAAGDGGQAVSPY